ncbi:hypothetical protein A7X83_06090 [Stenotrophomonas maltophilia]|uniref:Uncharacterized protein n=1 Tax=Stenotrophomonas maltophilia TaxID=40324 RepID=A0A2W6ICQ6_STEMA|nr:hypothetical protein A7X83_06090 [Stenotrophomonas maltophilia]
MDSLYVVVLQCHNQGACAITIHDIGTNAGVCKQVAQMMDMALRCFQEWELGADIGVIAQPWAVGIRPIRKCFAELRQGQELSVVGEEGHYSHLSVKSQKVTSPVIRHRRPRFLFPMPVTPNWYS